MLLRAICVVALAIINIEIVQVFQLNQRQVEPVQPIWGIIEQRVDNFNQKNVATWKMRYLSNDQFFKLGASMFIYIGGEWTSTPAPLMSGQVYDMAKEHQGYMFYTEHRFFGKSFPTKSTANLQYLSPAQAIEDLIHFIETKKATTSGVQNSKVVLIGGSYGGILATWTKLIYPNKVDAVYASSPPLDLQVDFYRFFEVINNGLELAHPKCVETVTKAIAEIEEHLKTPTGNDYVKNIFNICERIINRNPHRAHFFTRITDTFVLLAQNAGADSLKIHCTTLDNYEGSATTKLAKFVMRGASPDQSSCRSGYDAYVKRYRSTTIPKDPEDNYRQRTYAQCAALGNFFSTNSPNQPFGHTIPLEYYYQLCADLFGESFSPSYINTVIHTTSRIYGGLKPNVTKVVFVQGTADPWHAAAAMESISDMAPVIVINGTSHCADLKATGDDTAPELRAAQLRVQELIREWIK